MQNQEYLKELESEYKLQMQEANAMIEYAAGHSKLEERKEAIECLKDASNMMYEASKTASEISAVQIEILNENK